ncbi:LNS2 domain-containing protein [Mycolicibacterium nivoides]|uniref:Polynucleotide kinase PNKP phosphatase domain-containing protein n=1 Tax=Mycolicibacterium nivoides TaxID=2487344 RepID=A0ABW9LL19_9MYCO
MTDAVIVDVDGTLCDVSSVRHFVAARPKDFDAFHCAAETCPPHTHVLDEVREHHHAGHRIVVVTARMYRWEQSTRTWLDRHMPVPYVGPFMRGDNDFRADVEVKRDIHRILTRDHGFRIVHCIDDNPEIVALWTELGIPTTVVPGWTQ